MDVLHRLADTVTDADSIALGPAMHVAHMLVMRQGADGLWPAALNARTGLPTTCERSAAPIELYIRLNAMLDTTEFDHVLKFAAERRQQQPGGHFATDIEGKDNRFGV
jgi:hypothetical protein